MFVAGSRTFFLTRRALASSRWSPHRLRQIAENRLRKLLMHAFREVPLYRALYTEAGFQPEEFRSLDDLDKIPTVTKQRLKAAPPEEVVMRGIDPARCTAVNTSGSTGVPLRIYLGARDQQWQRAVAWRILFEHGFRWTDRTLEIRMSFGQQFFVQRLGLAPKDWMSVVDSPVSWAQRLAQRRHEIVVAGAGTLHALAAACETLQIAPPQPRIVISDSETLAPATRRYVQRVLHTNPVDVFGLVELSNFAWQCEYRDGFHVSADSHIVEVNAPAGEPGALIATALGMWTMPIIRYETGDLAEIDPEPCPCGRSLPRLRRIYGRAVDSVVLPSGSRLLWPFFHEVLGGYGEIHQWRILQEAPHRLRLQLVLLDDYPGLRERLATSLRDALPEAIELLIERVDAIPAVPGRKTRMIVSTLELLDGVTDART